MWRHGWTLTFSEKDEVTSVFGKFCASVTSRKFQRPWKSHKSKAERCNAGDFWKGGFSKTALATFLLFTSQNGVIWRDPSRKTKEPPNRKKEVNKNFFCAFQNKGIAHSATASASVAVRLCGGCGEGGVKHSVPSCTESHKAILTGSLCDTANLRVYFDYFRSTKEVDPSTPPPHRSLPVAAPLQPLSVKITRWE